MSYTTDVAQSDPRPQAGRGERVRVRGGAATILIDGFSETLAGRAGLV
jgi:hypothetical protein